MVPGGSPRWRGHVLACAGGAARRTPPPVSTASSSRTDASSPPTANGRASTTASSSRCRRGAAIPPPSCTSSRWPASEVDWERTERYATALQAQNYAATRGEADFARLSDDVARTLNDIATVKDPAERLARAELARKTLNEWPGAHYALSRRRSPGDSRAARRGDRRPARQGRPERHHARAGRAAAGAARRAAAARAQPTPRWWSSC